MPAVDAYGTIEIQEIGKEKKIISPFRETNDKIVK